MLKAMGQILTAVVLLGMYEENKSCQQQSGMGGGLPVLDLHRMVRGPLCPAGLVGKQAESVVGMCLLMHSCLLACSPCVLPHSLLH